MLAVTVSVCPSVTSRSSIETAEQIEQILAQRHKSPPLALYIVFIR